MAWTTRYFSPVATGDGSGTNLANAAALFPSGNWSTVITGFDFTLGSLFCRVVPGEYTVPSTLATTSFSVSAPTTGNNLRICGVNSTDNIITCGEWVSAQPEWDMSDSPLFTAENYLICNFGVSFTGMRVVSSHVNGFSNCILSNMHVTLSGNGLQGIIGSTSNMFIKITSSNYNSGISYTGSHFNCRIEGNPDAFGANQQSGVGSSGASSGSISLNCCTSFNHPNAAFSRPRPGVNNLILTNCVGYACDKGYLQNGGGTHCFCENSVFASCNTVFFCNSPAIMLRNRARNYTALDNGSGTLSLQDNLLAAGTDAAEFVNAANGDFRIKSGSIYWGRGIGAGDEIAGTGGTRPVNPFTQQVIG